jgi:pimeloyl-ACP methyl ester carboxylesterase
LRILSGNLGVERSDSTTERVSYGYGDGRHAFHVRGQVRYVTLGLGTLTSVQPVRVMAVDSTEYIPGSGSWTPTGDSASIESNHFRSVSAIMGVGLRIKEGSKGVANPLAQLPGNGKYIIRFPGFGGSKGKLIVNPDSVDTKGFTLFKLEKGVFPLPNGDDSWLDNELSGCISASGGGSACQNTLLDTGTPGLRVFPGKNLFGTAFFFDHDVLYDQVNGMIGIKKKRTTSSMELNIFDRSLNVDTMKNYPVHYRTTEAGGVKIFYREAGPKDAPVILLMHGYPTSSFMFRNLIPILSKQYHVIAPDLPGFGFTEMPSREEYHYTFENLTATMQAFIDTLGLKRFAIYVFDYGAPVGLRLALANPEKITGIISQNGNAYEQGLLDWSNGLVKAYWENDNQTNRDALRKYFTLEGIIFQYRQGASDSSLIAPEAIYLDNHQMERSGNVDIQLDLILDYRTNVKLYPAFQAYFRKYQPKLLAVWGNRDPYFGPAGAEGFKKDDPNAIVKFYDTGHFALETHYEEIGRDILAFMQGLPK